MTHETNYFIKEEAHDHRKATNLVMSLQSSEIKLAGAILPRVLILKKITFNTIRVTGDPENILRTAKEISILPLGYCYRPQRSLYTKNYVHTTTTELMGLKGINCIVFLPHQAICSTSDEMRINRYNKLLKTFLEGLIDYK